ncbi:hypothetical protein SDC9_181378 [bioreactor metagenome]|uniref:Uncharacterized protein n=1 Tax=bioreactor metagenome TaxID=1076179 RepID=A0A645H5X5_9ZZZZ
MGQSALYGSFFHLQALQDTGEGKQNFIQCQKSFREEGAPVGTVIQSTFQEGMGIIVPGSDRGGGQYAGQAVDLFSIHRVAFEGHG